MCSVPAALFFSLAGRPVLPLSFIFGLDRGHAHDGGARNRRTAARMSVTPAASQTRVLLGTGITPSDPSVTAPTLLGQIRPQR